MQYYTCMMDKCFLIQKILGTSKNGSVDEKMSELTNDGEIRNTIIVGIWNTEFRHSEYFPQKPFENLPKNSRLDIQ